MFPRQSIDDMPDVSVGDSEFNRQLLRRNHGIKFTDITNFIRRQLVRIYFLASTEPFRIRSGVMSISVGHTSFLDRILHIVFLSANKQVDWAYAPAVIAMMTDKLCRWNRAFVDLPRKAMSVNRLSACSGKHTITGDDSRRPFPAVIANLNVAPEPLNFGHPHNLFNAISISIASLIALTLAACTPPASNEASPTPDQSAPAQVVASPTPTPKRPAAPSRPVIVLPPPPVLTEEGMGLLLSTGGRALVLEFETGGRAGYDPHPEWPGGASGVTIGIGFDCGYYSRSVILSDWAALRLNDRTRLADTTGITGQKARAKKNEVRDIFVEWSIATDVFDRVDVAREFASAKRAIPGFEEIRLNAQAAIISLGFNRGWGMSGPNRVEFRAIRDLVPFRDYEGIAFNFRKMKRVWTGTAIQNGMHRRREAEAKLVMTP